MFNLRGRITEELKRDVPLKITRGVLPMA